MTERTEIVVVGSGFAGLAAAAHAGRAGRRVLLLERAHEPGGRARTREERGYRFNLGPHALYPRSRAELHALGVEVTGGYPNVRFIGVEGGRLETLPTNTGSLLATGLLGVREKLELAIFLGRLDAAVADAGHDEPLTRFLERRLGHARSRAVVETAARVATYTHAPDRLSARAAMEQVRAALPGVTYVDGGWQTIVEGLAAAADAAGVVRRSGARVASVAERAGAAAGVVLAGGEHIDAGAVILAIGPGDAAAVAPWSGTLRDSARRAEPVRAACLDLALSALPRPDQPVAFGVDEPLYLSAHSPYARLAPPEGATVLVARYLQPGEAIDADAVRHQLETYADLIQPGWRERLVAARFFPALEVHSALADAAYHGLAGRTPVAVPDAPGLYVAGDWVGDEGMLADAALLSARRAATLAATGIRDTAGARPALEAVR